MGNATSLFNLMRNIGGSVGIAVTGTMLTRQRQTWRACSVRHITIYDPQTQTMLAQLKAGFMARGADAVTATERAYAALHGMLLPAGVDGVVRLALPAARRDLPDAAAVDSDHAAAEGAGAGGRGALRGIGTRRIVESRPIDVRLSCDSWNQLDGALVG